MTEFHANDMKLVTIHRHELDWQVLSFNILHLAVDKNISAQYYNGKKSGGS